MESQEGLKEIDRPFTQELIFEPRSTFFINDEIGIRSGSSSRQRTLFIATESTVSIIRESELDIPKKPRNPIPGTISNYRSAFDIGEIFYIGPDYRITYQKHQNSQATFLMESNKPITVDTGSQAEDLRHALTVRMMRKK